ncbi:MAG: TlpA disulfide reductase family protein [Bacteroidota bacterium]
MKKETKFLGTIVLLLVGLTAINSYQIYTLQAINKKMHKSTANMAVQLKEFMAPPPPPESIAVGATAPDFSLKNTENETVSLGNLQKDKKKILVFSSSSCPYCEAYYPELDKFTKENKDIEVFLVQAESTIEENKKFIAEHGYDFEVLTGEDASVWVDYKVAATPTTIILDDENKVLSSTLSSSYTDLANLFDLLEAKS